MASGSGASAATAATGVPPKRESLRSILRDAPPARLYSELFDQKLFEKESPEIVVREVRARFRKKYPRNERGFEKETVVRAGILKAMRMALKPGKPGVPQREVYEFYRSLFKAEPWPVRRQALMNIREWLPAKSEAERAAVLKAAGERAVASVNLSDEEILQEVFRE